MIGIRKGAALVLAAALAGAAHAAEPVLEESPTLPEGWVAIPERHWQLLQDEPIVRFRAARRELEAGDTAGAATELRKGAVYLRVESARAEGAARLDLALSATEIEELAARAEARTPPDFEVLQAAVARSHHALAVAHAERALAAHEAGREQAASAELETAALYVENADQASGGLIAKGARATVDQLRNLAGGVVRADGWAIKQVGGAVRALGQGLEKVGKTVQPASPEHADD